MFEMGKKPEAESLYLSAKAIFRAGPNRSTDLTFAACLRNLGRLYYEQDRFDQAQTTLEACLVIEMNAPNKQQGEIAMVLGELGNVFYRRGLDKEASERYLRAAEIVRMVWTESNPNWPIYLSDLGASLTLQGRLDAAATLIDSAYQLCLKAGDEDVWVMRDLADCWEEQRKYAKAEQLNYDGYELRRVLRDSGHPDWWSAIWLSPTAVGNLGISSGRLFVCSSCSESRYPKYTR